jgi:hypothetical protein
MGILYRVVEKSTDSVTLRWIGDVRSEQPVLEIPADRLACDLAVGDYAERYYVATSGIYRVRWILLENDPQYHSWLVRSTLLNRCFSTTFSS